MVESAWDPFTSPLMGLAEYLVKKTVRGNGILEGSEVPKYCTRPGSRTWCAPGFKQRRFARNQKWAVPETLALNQKAALRLGAFANLLQP